MLRRLRAFTLIELALVLVIVSLMTGFGMQAVESTAGVNCYETTQAQLNTIDDALKNYAATKKRYPKPAYMTSGSADADFGKEARNGIVAADNTPAFGSAVPTGMSNSSGILFGALPHTTLGLPAQYAADCWGDKFTYAVVNSQTSSDNTSGYTSGTQGTIQLKGGTIASPVDLSTNAVYVVLSHGQDKYGATPLTVGGTTAKNCNGSSAAKIDRENCNTDTVFFNSMRNTGTTDKYFDDMLVFSSKTQSVEDCPGQMVSWGTGNNCTAGTSTVNHGGAASVTNTTTNWTGHANLSCSDGVLTVSSIDCFPSAPCGANDVLWGAGCKGYTGATIVHGQNPRVSVNNTADNKQGSVQVTCNNGTFDLASGVCNPAPACSPGGIAWSGEDSGCTATVGSMTAGQLINVPNTTSWYAGSTDVECRNTTNGADASVFVTKNSICKSTPPSPCGAQSVTWGGCTGTAPAMAHNGSAAVTDSNSNKTGSGTASCYNGVSSATGSCYNDCMAGTQSWGAGCSASFPQIAGNGASSTQNNTAGGYTGSTSVTCNNGTPSQSGATCALIVNGSCGTANGASTTSAPSTNLCNQGAATAVTGSGPYNWTCTGSGGGSTANCSSNRGCSYGMIEWITTEGCYNYAPSGTSAHGFSQYIFSLHPNWTGAETITCNQGNWTESGATCTAVINGACGSSNGVSMGSPPSSGLCNAGTPTAVGGSNPYTWNCNGSGGGSNASCATGAAPTNGVCGGANGGSTMSAPSSSLCNSGSPTSVTGSGPYNWNCNGSGGGSNASCSSNRSCAGASIGTMNWSGNCSASVPDAAHGNAPVLTNAAGGYTGSITMNCSQGSWNPTSATCNASSSCSPAAQAAFEALCPYQNSGGSTDWNGQSWQDCQPCGGSYVATCYSENTHSEYGAWDDNSYYWQSMRWDGSGSAYYQGASCSRHYTSSTYPGGYHDDYSGTCPYPGPTCAAAQNGVCGSYQGGNTNSAPSGPGLCSTGTASGVSGSGPWTWTCNGVSGGSNASCTSYRLCNGTTVSWGGGCSASVATANYNDGATRTNTAGGYTGSAYVGCGASGSWTTSSTSCTPTATPINGVCGGGGTCVSGTYELVSSQDCVCGSLGDRWNCLGQNGGTDASCADCHGGSNCT